MAITDKTKVVGIDKTEGMDNIPVEVMDEYTPSTIYTGQVNVSMAGVRVKLKSTSTSIKGVRVKAKSGNTGNIYVGGSNVSNSNGYILAAGEEVAIPIDDLSKVYIDADNSGEGVSYLAVA